MIATLATLISTSLEALSWLSPVEVLAVAGMLSYAIGGLVAVRIIERRAIPTTKPRTSREAATRPLRELNFRLSRSHPA
jgi:hypothetical protein